jgi:HEAT repeat protein
MSADPRATVAFFATLSDPDPKIRELAVEAIAFPHDGASSQNQDDSEPQDSFRDDPAAARALLPLLDDPVEPVRAATRNGLRAVGGPDDAALLERIARFSGSGDEVSGALANTATAAGSTDFSAEIVGYLRLLTCGVGGGSDIRAAWRAAQALGRLDVQGVAALAAVLRDPDLYPRTSRIWAIEALDASENTQAIPALLDALRGVVPDSSVEGYFADLPDDRSLGEELRAAHALVRLGEAGITALEEVLRDQGASARTRWAARDALDSLPRDTDATDRPL